MQKNTKTTFTADDGKRFDNAEDAKRHEALASAKDEYETSKKAYAKLLWNSQKTADGIQFNLTCSGEYFFLREGISIPSIHRVSFFGWNCTLNEDDETVIIQEETRHAETRHHTYKISELYKMEKSAQLAKVEALKRYISWAEDDIKDTKAKLGADK